MADTADDTSAAAAPNQGPKTYTPSGRIAELNDIDKSVSELLSSAAEAVGLLSNSTQNVTPVPKTLAAAQARFTKASSTYFSTLSAIEVRLRRQVYALEEAGLIEEGTEKDAKAGRSLGSTDVARRGGGALDPSWLNARADTSVELKMRKELLERQKQFLERMKAEGKLSDEPATGNEAMEVKEEP
jgi:hypothetical protein